jgi:hypothetical protein
MEPNKRPRWRPCLQGIQLVETLKEKRGVEDERKRIFLTRCIKLTLLVELLPTDTNILVSTPTIPFRALSSKGISVKYLDS